ncbi:MAG: hypothetical protein M1836_004592 [Candelina mexicana]|nr:MAG: hypothetical protein M1836_004592 [Candelina mexicana]
MPEVISLVEDSSEDERDEDLIEELDSLPDTGSDIEEVDDLDGCDGPHWHYGGDITNPVYDHREGQFFGVVKPSTPHQPVRVSRRYLESQLHWSLAHHPTLDEDTITLPMSTLSDIISGTRHIRSPTLPDNNEINLHSPDISARLGLCARQIESDYELAKAVDTLVEGYNVANPGKKRKFEEYLWNEEEISERKWMERAERVEKAGPRRRFAGMRAQKAIDNKDSDKDDSDKSSNPTDKDHEIASLERQLNLLKRQKRSPTSPSLLTYTSKICAGGCGSDATIKHPHIIGQEWALQPHDPPSTNTTTTNVHKTSLIHLHDITFPTISSTYKQCLTTHDPETALGLLDLLSQAAATPIVCDSLMFCQAQVVSSVTDAFRIIIVLAIRWVPAGQKPLRPFFQGAVGVFSQRWRVMEAIAGHTTTAARALELVDAFYRDLPAALVEGHGQELEMQRERVKGVVVRRGA